MMGMESATIADEYTNLRTQIKAKDSALLRIRFVHYKSTLPISVENKLYKETSIYYLRSYDIIKIGSPHHTTQVHQERRLLLFYLNIKRSHYFTVLEI